MKELSKEDKKFLLKLSVDNRNYLTTLASILISMAFSFLAFIFAILSVLLNLNIMNDYKPYLAIVFLTIAGVTLYIMGKEWKRDFDRAKKLQEQYDKELKELYPELKRYYH